MCDADDDSARSSQLTIQIADCCAVARDKRRVRTAMRQIDGAMLLRRLRDQPAIRQQRRRLYSQCWRNLSAPVANDQQYGAVVCIASVAQCVHVSALSAIQQYKSGK